MLDSLVFGPQEPDISTGNLNDGVPLMVTFEIPTPGVPNFGGCGVRSYDQLNPLAHQLDLIATGTGAIGSPLLLDASGFQPATAAYLTLGIAPGYAVLNNPSTVALLNPLQVFSRTTDISGTTNFPIVIPQDSSLIGADLYFQYVGFSSGGKLELSNAIHVNICP